MKEEEIVEMTELPDWLAELKAIQVEKANKRLAYFMSIIN